MTQAVIDAGIVGAGFAGLAAALTLRRHRQSALVCDGGLPSNAPAAEVYDYLGARGMSARQLRQVACEQVRDVGGQIVSARITSVEREPGQFVLVSNEGRCWRVRRLLLATGVRHAYPDIENFFEFYGRSVYHCPHCDGYEVRDQPIAIIDWHEHALPFALTLTQWTRQITVVTDGRSPELTLAERDALAAHGIPILTQTVHRFEGENGQLTRLRFADGAYLPVCSALFNVRHDVNSALAEQLGCALTDDGYVVVDSHLRTSVEHVWAAGDIAGEEQILAVASAHGVKAGVDIYRSLPLPSGEPVPT
jgi:thioredoxin reductase